VSLIVAVLLLLPILRELSVGTVLAPIPLAIRFLLQFHETAIDRETHPKWFWFFIGLQACCMLIATFMGLRPEN